MTTELHATGIPSTSTLQTVEIKSPLRGPQVLGPAPAAVCRLLNVWV